MSVDVARIAFASREYRTVGVADPTVLARRPLSTELEYNTMLANGTDAVSFGNFVLSMLKLDRYNWIAVVKNEGFSIRIGQTVKITHPRLGLKGRNFIVKRIRRDSRALFQELTLFGPERPYSPVEDYALIWDFENNIYGGGETQLSGISSVSGYSYSRLGAKSELSSVNIPVPFASNVPAIIQGKGYVARGTRTNIALQSQNFTSLWSGSGMTATANQTTAPDGTTTADLITVTSAAGSFLSQGVTVISTGVYTTSVFAKAGTGRYFQLINGSTGSDYCNFDLVAGVVGSSSGCTGSIVDCGNGWFRCVAYGSATSSSATIAIAGISSLTTGRTGTSPNGSTYYVWEFGHIFGGVLPITSGGPIISTTTTAATIDNDVLTTTNNIFTTDQDFVIWAKVKHDTLGSRSVYLHLGRGGTRIIFYKEGDNILRGEQGGATVTIATLTDTEMTMLYRRKAGKDTFGMRCNGTTFLSTETTRAWGTYNTNLDIAYFGDSAYQLDGSFKYLKAKFGAFSDSEITSILDNS